MLNSTVCTVSIPDRSRHMVSVYCSDGRNYDLPFPKTLFCRFSHVMSAPASGPAARRTQELAVSILCSGRACILTAGLDLRSLRLLTETLPKVTRLAARWKYIGLTSDVLAATAGWSAESRQRLAAAETMMTGDQQRECADLFRAHPWLDQLLGSQARAMLQRGFQLAWLYLASVIEYRAWISKAWRHPAWRADALP